MEKRVYVIGDRDAVLGFALVGVDGLATGDPAAAAERLAALRKDASAGLVLVTSGLARQMGPQLEAFRAAADLPLVYEIPDRQGRPSRPPVATLVRQALGVGGSGAAVAEQEGLRALEQEILRAAEERAGEITAVARARAAEVRRQAREDAAAERARSLATAQEEAERARSRAESAAQLEARSRRLAAREAAIARVLEAARGHLASGLTAAEREAALEKAIAEAALGLGGGRLTVRGNEEDLSLLTPALRQRLQERLARQGVAAELEPGAPAAILGGAIVSKEGGRVVVDNSFDARLERQSWVLRNEIWQALTEEIPEAELAL